MKAYKLNGSLFFVRREDFEAINFFDENIFMYHEETILGAYTIDCDKICGVGECVSVRAVARETLS